MVNLSIKRVNIKGKYYIQGRINSKLKFQDKWSQKNSLPSVKKKVDNKQKGYILKIDTNKFGRKTVRKTEHLQYTELSSKPKNAQRVVVSGMVLAEIQVKKRTQHREILVVSPTLVLIDNKIYRFGVERSKQWLMNKMKQQATAKLFEEFKESGIGFSSDDIISLSEPKGLKWNRVTNIV